MPTEILKLVQSYESDGLFFCPEPVVQENWLESPVSFGVDMASVMFLSQILEEGFAVTTENGVLVPWELVYQLLNSTTYYNCEHFLKLPEMLDLRPSLTSHGSLSDHDFSIILAGWTNESGMPLPNDYQINGAVIYVGHSRFLLPQSAWELIKAVRCFHRRTPGERNLDSNMKYWSDIRVRALEADAELSDFLLKTVVVTPQMLKLQLRKADFGDSKTVEVIPTFEGAPERWLEQFDRLPQVENHYRITENEKLTHVVISEEVMTVLREIKRMPGRRVSGVRAEAFVRNPFGVLGPEAAQVVNPEAFDHARDEAGLYFSRFTARVLRDEQKFPFDISLLIEETSNGEIRSDEYHFQGAEDLGRFVVKLEDRISKEAQCCFWNGYDLEILGDTGDQLLILKAVLHDLKRSECFSHAEIFDLSRYSDRIDGFGVEKPYYSPFVARKSAGEPWVPENADFGICYTPEGQTEPISIVLNDDIQERLKKALEQAKSAGKESFVFSGFPKEISINEAEDLIKTINETKKDIEKGTFSPDVKTDKQTTGQRKGLVVKPNIESLDYLQSRGSLTLQATPKPRLCSGLLPSVTLKEHQLYGVAWLQHLWALAPSHCRGALLADDMGLGKTLQLLAFIGACFEENPFLDPVIVVAPVSLLENWQEEIAKFFKATTFTLLTLYGPALAEKRAPRAGLDSDLVASGVNKLLKRNWLGNAKLVLTTYETLRDLEFSLASQKWSIMVCDESQKIKNPNAMVTRAAKKQNVQFKIACTGTPVENTLTDLWCQFDFIQPGLLGALNDFGGTYRKPIEAETDEEKQKVAELRAIIAPQILRREKKDVAKDLPNKIIVDDCRQLPLSPLMRNLYGHAVSMYRSSKTGDTSSSIKNHLGLLQYIRRLCSDPRPYGQVAPDFEPFETLAQNSPKIAWLDGLLKGIQKKGEKVIIFTELRDLQRMLKRCIIEQLGVVPEIINGDTSTSSANSASRQKKIKEFQQKPGFGVIILSPLAVGFGVNIQAANHVIHYTRMWNPSKEDQATDRAYRIGQTKDVYVYYPVVVAPDFTTFDAKLDRLLDWKRGLSADMLNGAGDVGATEFGDLEDVDGSSAFGNSTLTIEDVLSLQPDAFEAYCSILWAKRGFSKTYRTSQSGDGGIDVVAIKGKNGALLQCKTSTLDGNRLDWEAIKDVVAGAAAYSIKHPAIDFNKVAVTNQYFNDGARHQANLNRVELVERNHFEKLVEDYPVKYIELEQLLLGKKDIF